MPRQARLILDNVCYHVITRGNQKQAIFKNDNDRRTYLKFVSKYKERHKFKIYGWCMMNNHVHMVMESDSLSKAMHGINLSYAQYFGYKYKIEHNRSLLIKHSNLVDKILQGDIIEKEDRQTIGSVLCALSSSKDRINYFIIFFSSAVVLIIALYLDFLKR